MANNSLSPNRATQRLLKYRAAVMTIARYRAKQAVKASEDMEMIFRLSARA
jgi:hypothetical protein